MPQRFEEVSFTISGTATGVYLAYPTTDVFKQTYRGHSTLVNHGDTKIGIACENNFLARENEYMETFGNEVAFFPILQVNDLVVLRKLGSMLLPMLAARYPMSGRAREWFRTVERQSIADLVWQTFDQGNWSTVARNP
jgi:hypothetical protein